MLECNRFIRNKMTKFTRVAALLLPVVCMILLLTQTAFAKNTYLINDGGRVTVHTTYATDPATVLNEAGLELGKDDTYTTQEGIGMSEITVQRKQSVYIDQSGKTFEVTSYGETVGELLNRLNFNLTADDVVSAPLDTVIYNGMTLTISRSVEAEETCTSAIPFETTYCYDPSLNEGDEVVLTPGVEGQLLSTALVRYLNGEEISRSVISETVVRQPVNAVIAVGTYVEQAAPETMPPEPAPEPPKKPQIDKKPAPSKKPEPSKQPVIKDGVIITPEGEVLTYTRSMQSVATAYTNTDPGCSEWTATGTVARYGAIAVDPKVIPYGTRMYIVSNDGKYVYGTAVAEDCGGAIKGNRIDLYYDTEAECWDFGVRGCTIYFLG